MCMTSAHASLRPHDNMRVHMHELWRQASCSIGNNIMRLTFCLSSQVLCGMAWSRIMEKRALCLLWYFWHLSESLSKKKKVLRHKINLSLSRALGLDPYDSAESKPNLVRICPQEIANEARVRHVSGASDAFDLHCVTQKVKWWNGPQRPQRPQPPHILTWHYPETWSKLLISGERPPGKWWVLVTRPASLFAQCLFLHSLLIPTKHNKTSYWLQSEYIVKKRKKKRNRRKRANTEHTHCNRLRLHLECRHLASRAPCMHTIFSSMMASFQIGYIGVALQPWELDLHSPGHF